MKRKIPNSANGSNAAKPETARTPAAIRTGYFAVYDQPYRSFHQQPGRKRPAHDKSTPSGCFRSKDGADIFCRVRSFLSTCRKNSLSASEALTPLFAGKLPDFL